MKANYFAAVLIICLDHTNEIAVIVHQYLKLVLEEGIKEWIYEEVGFIHKF